jgi:hypothetical protein
MENHKIETRQKMLMTSSAGLSVAAGAELEPPNVERMEPHRPSSSLPLSASRRSSFFLSAFFETLSLMILL